MSRGSAARSWVAVVAGVSLASGLSVWLLAEEERRAQDGTATARGPTPGFARGERRKPPRPRLEITAIDVSAPWLTSA